MHELWEQAVQALAAGFVEDSINQPFIVLTETKFSYRHIPVWARYSPHIEDLEALEYELRPVKAQQDPPTTKIKIPRRTTQEHDDLSVATGEAAYQEELQAEEEGLKRAWDGLLATRVVEGHVGTPSIPTPEAEFMHPRKLEEAHITSIGEDPTHWEVDSRTPHSKPRARRSRWDKGPPSAATDVQGNRRKKF
jgi:hypothetical protein